MKIKTILSLLIMALAMLSKSSIYGACNKEDGTKYELLKIAIAGHGANGGADDTTENSRASKTGFTTASVDTGQKFLDKLEELCGNDKSISKLTIFSHGYSLGIILLSDSGFYAMNSYGNSESGNMGQLKTLIDDNKVRFCEPVIKLQSCNTANGSLPKLLSEHCEGICYGATGYSSPVISGGQETGWFYSDSSSWKKYKRGALVSNPHLNDSELSTPNSYGTNKLKCW